MKTYQVNITIKLRHVPDGMEQRLVNEILALLPHQLHGYQVEFDATSWGYGGSDPI